MKCNLNKKKPFNRWTPEADKKLLDLCSQGFSDKKVMQELRDAGFYHSFGGIKSRLFQLKKLDNTTDFKVDMVRGPYHCHSYGITEATKLPHTELCTMHLLQVKLDYITTFIKTVNTKIKKSNILGGRNLYIDCYDWNRWMEKLSILLNDTNET